MKYFIFCCTIAIALISYTGSFAQETFRTLNSAKTLALGDELLSQDRADAALREYYKIQEGDSNYYESQVAILKLYLAQNKYENVIEIAKKNLEKPNNFNLQFHLFQCIGFNGMSLYDSTLYHLKKIEDKYPYSPTLQYHIGLAYFYKNKLEMATDYFTRSIKLNPFYSYPHLMLGKIMILEGLRSKAIMAMETYLALNPSDLGSLKLLESLFHDAVTDEATKAQTENNDIFRDLDLIIKSKAAMDPRFQSRFDMDLSTPRQTELIFSMLPEGNRKDDFWSDFYLPLFRTIKKENLAEAFIYYILSPSNSETVDKWLDKNEKTKTTLFTTANSFLSEKRSSLITTAIESKKENRTFWFYNNNKLNAIGDQIDDETYVGPWIFFYPNDEIQIEGAYDNKGIRQGKWNIYFENGRLAQSVKFSEGLKTDTSKVYFDNGALKTITPYKNDTIRGEVKNFSRFNTLSEWQEYNNDLKEGKGVNYYLTGNKAADYLYKKDTLEGPSILYYKNGQIRERQVFTKGELDGEIITYHPNGKIYQKGRYENGKQTGMWQSFFDGGEKEFAAEMKDGHKVGEWNYYDKKGQMRSLELYDSDGNKTGTWKYYDEDGVLTEESFYKKDLFIGYKFYDTEGKVLSEALDSTGTFKYTVYVNNKILMEGNYAKGKLDGLVTTYFPTSIVKSKAYYKNGELNGSYLEHYPSGELAKEMYYKDGLLTGPYKEFYRNGNPYIDGYTIDGNSENLWKYYYPDSTVHFEFFYISNQAEGTSREYDVDGILKYEYSYDSDVVVGCTAYDSAGQVAEKVVLPYGTGTFSLKYSNGQKRFEKELIAGQPVSDIKFFYKSGALQELCHIKNGLYEGKRERYYPDGKLSSVTTYFNDEENGPAKGYHENGNLSYEGTYKNGNKEGLWKYYYENGNIKSKTHYKEDDKYGSDLSYDESGEIMIERFYHPTKDIAYRYMLPSGEWSDMKKLEKGAGKIEGFYKNGAKSFSYEYYGGHLNGRQYEFHPNGKPKEEFSMRHGEYEGDFKIYYPNGTLKSEIFYKDGLAEGPAREYFENGNLKTETFYHKDEKNGWETTYNEDGSKKAKNFFRDGSEY